MKYFQWNLSYGPLFVPANKWNDSSGYFSVILLKALWLLLSELLLSTARPHHISGQVLSSHSIVLLSRTVRPCSPCVGRWIEKWRTTWSKVCSSAPHSYAAEGTITHVSKQERQRPRAVRRRLRRTHSVLVRVIPGVWVPVSEMKVRNHVVFSNHSAFHWWSAQSAFSVVIVRWTDEFMCGRDKWVSRFGMPFIHTRCTGEGWVEQLSRLHGTALYPRVLACVCVFFVTVIHV